MLFYLIIQKWKNRPETQRLWTNTAPWTPGFHQTGPALPTWACWRLFLSVLINTTKSQPEPCCSPSHAVASDSGFIIPIPTPFCLAFWSYLFISGETIAVFHVWLQWNAKQAGPGPAGTAGCGVDLADSMWLILNITIWSWSLPQEFITNSSKGDFCCQC